MDTFAWAIENFDINVLKNDARLILPTNDFYPGTVSSIDEMAQAMFVKTKNYAGMQKWPIELVSTVPTSVTTINDLALGTSLRGEQAEVSLSSRLYCCDYASTRGHFSDLKQGIASWWSSISTSSDRSCGLLYGVRGYFC